MNDHQLSAKEAVERFFRDTWVDVSTLRTSSEALGVKDWYSSGTYILVQPHHCVNWTELSKELRFAIVSAVMAYFEDKGVVFDHNKSVITDALGTRALTHIDVTA